MKYTTKKVLQTKEALLGIVGMSDLAEAASMLTAYAAVLEHSPRVTNEVIERACKVASEHPYGLVQGVPWPDGWDNDELDRSRAAMRAALEAVWPVAAKSKPTLSEFVRMPAAARRRTEDKIMTHSDDQILSAMDAALVALEYLPGCDAVRTKRNLKDARDSYLIAKLTMQNNAYAEGWRRAAQWAKRNDLLADIGSPAYEQECHNALGRK